MWLLSAGLWVDLASGRQPGVTCKRSWDSTGGSRRDFLMGAAVVLLLQFQSVWFRRIGGFFLTLLFVLTLSIHGGLSGFTAGSAHASLA